MTNRIILTILLVLFSTSTFAGPPPMSKKDLLRHSSTVVKGTVTDVKCTGEFIEEYCGSLTGYRARVKVNSVLKGEPFSTLNLNFHKYDYSRLCMGTSDTMHYEGEEAVYYLVCESSGCRFTHWNGINYIKKSSKRLPKCRKKKKR